MAKLRLFMKNKLIEFPSGAVGFLCLMFGLFFVMCEAQAEIAEIRLSCDSTLVVNYPSGRKTESSQKILVSIVQDTGGSGYLAISLQGTERIGIVSTLPGPKKKRIVNGTDLRRWKIYTETEDDPGLPMIIDEILIDRQEGTLRFNSDFRRGSIGVAGVCERMDNKPNRF